MKKGVAVLMIFCILLISGCASQKEPDVICKSPYMRHGDGCCMDRNANSICDEDEDEEPIFVEPKYDEPAQKPPITDLPEMDWEQPEQEQETVQEPEGVYVGEKTAVEEVPSPYTAVETELVGWSVENKGLLFEVTGLTIEVEDVVPRHKFEPDKRAYLREVDMRIRNKDYVFVTPKLYFQVMDSKDPLIIKDTMMCDRSDDLPIDNCESALKKGREMEITMHVDMELPRLELDKTFLFRFSNRRDDSDAGTLELRKIVDPLGISGAEYI